MSPTPPRQYHVPGARDALEFLQSLGSEGAPTPLALPSTEAPTPLALPSTEAPTRLALPSTEAPTRAALPSMGPPARLALPSTEQQAGQGELADLHWEAAVEQELGDEGSEDEDEEELEDEPPAKNDDEEGVAGVPRLRKHAELSEAERAAKNRANKLRSRANQKAAKKAKKEKDAGEKKPRTDKAGRVSKPGQGQNQRQSGSQPQRGQPTSGSGFASSSSGFRGDRGRGNRGRGDRGRGDRGRGDRGRGGRGGYGNSAPTEVRCRTCGGGNDASIMSGAAPALVAAFPLLCFWCRKRREDAPEAPGGQPMPTLPTATATATATATTATPATVAPTLTMPAPLPSMAAPSVPAVNAFEAAMLRQDQLDAEADARRLEATLTHRRRRREMEERFARAEEGGNLAAYYETPPPPESVYGRPLGSRQPPQPQGRIEGGHIPQMIAAPPYEGEAAHTSPLPPPPPPTNQTPSAENAMEIYNPPASGNDNSAMRAEMGNLRNEVAQSFQQVGQQVGQQLMGYQAQNEASLAQTHAMQSQSLALQQQTATRSRLQSQHDQHNEAIGAFIAMHQTTVADPVQGPYHRQAIGILTDLRLRLGNGLTNGNEAIDGRLMPLEDILSFHRQWLNNQIRAYGQQLGAATVDFLAAQEAVAQDAAWLAYHGQLLQLPGPEVPHPQAFPPVPENLNIPEAFLRALPGRFEAAIVAFLEEQARAQRARNAEGRGLPTPGRVEDEGLE